MANRVAASLGVLVCLSGPALVQADDTTASVFDAGGFNRNRDFFSQLPFEHIDPLTGNLLLTFTDLVLPGNAGFDLRIQRSYNSKIYRDYHLLNETLGEDSWAGVGWTLHLGRVFHYNFGFTAPPLIEMPDGSRHQTHAHIDSSGRFISRDFWIYDKNTQTLKLPDGVIYTFAHSANTSGIPGGSAAYATRIEDPFGNRIDVEYWNQVGASSSCQNASAPFDGLCKITQRIGTQTRVVTFTYETTYKSIRTMTYAGAATHTWTYTSAATNSAGHSLLTQVAPPVGTPWKYQYRTVAPYRYELSQLTTPNGGTIAYTYQEVTFYLGTTQPVASIAVAQRTTGGRDVVAGTWTYAFAQGSLKNQTVITAPLCGQSAASTTTHTFLGVGTALAAGPGWRVGLPSVRTLKQGTTTLETESYTWRTPAFNDRISDDNEIVGPNNQSTEIYVPLLETRTVTRGNVYTTAYAYNSTPYNGSGSSFNDYGRPRQVDETGELARTTTRTFRYGFTPYIVDRLATETVTVDGASFARSWTYNLANGFRTAETIHGITTSYGMETGTGNVRTVTDANGNVTTISYTWGVVKDTTTPQHVIQRTVNPEGTVATEKRRLDEGGFTTSFTYDLALRLTRRTPPVGSFTSTTYDNTAGATIVVARGTTSVTTNLDGFGRLSGTTNAVAVKTNANYDACGRKSLESLPFNTAYPEKDVTFLYDGLDRLTRRTNPDASTVLYAYTDIDVTITDEVGIKTRQDWSAFGDPDEARLVALTQSYQGTTPETTTYDYNALGSLTQVAHPTGGGMTTPLTRQWTYYGTGEAGGTPGLLKSEVHPESGTVSYSYWPAGNMKSRTDAQFGATNYTYDGNNRLISVNRPGTVHDTTMTYDQGDNRTSLSNAYVSSTLTYDGANRLTSRRDVVNGKTLLTGYTPDANDRIQTITHPSGRKTTYGYDNADRISLVKNGTTNAVYANTFSYHPSGQPLAFTAGNGIVHQFTYEANTHRLDTTTQLASVLKLDYAYDKVGNVLSITETTTGRTGMNQTFTYDPFHRVKTAVGPWTGGSTALAYDSVGNLRTTSIGGSTTFAYDNARSRITSAAGAYVDSFGYDLNGNTINASAGAKTFAYTPENMLETAVVAGATTTYRYDGDNLRKHKITGGSNRYYIHAPAGQLLGEYTESPCGAGILALTDYVYSGTRLLAAIEPPTPTVALTVATAAVAENAGSHTATVVLTTADGCATSGPATVAFATANGTATAGTDYTATAGTLSFPEGTPSGSTRTIAVPILNETLKENNETFGLTLSGPSGASLGVATQTVTIQDNDTPVISLLPFTSGPGTSGEHIGTATARIQVTTGDGNALAAVASAKYATGAGPAPSATAADYIPVALTALSFPVGTPSGTTHNVNVTIKQDTLVESDENFRVNLSAPVGAVLGTASVTVQIQDDEPTIALTSAIASVAESAGSIGVTVRLNTRSGFPTATAGAATVNYATANGTAVQASDYTRTTGVMTFPAGTANNATQTITVPILNDAVVEAAETFRVNITTPVGCRLGTPTTTTVTIQDDVGGRPQIINSLPYVVQKPGRYILVRSLSTDMTSGAAITVESDSVVLDLSGFALANTSGPETQAFGIHGVGRRDVVVRNGTIRGFLTAVKLEEGALLRVDDILAIGSRFSGLEICGSDSLVLRNRVVDTGADGSAFGIVACGSSLQVLDNDVLDTLGPEAHSVELRDASGAVISANRVGHSTPSSGVGLLVRDSEGVVVKGNRITGVERGIVFERSTGASMDNVMSGVAVPEEGVQP